MFETPNLLQVLENIAMITNDTTQHEDTFENNHLAPTNRIGSVLDEVGNSTNGKTNR